MLIEFSVKNFGSFKEQQKLILTPTKGNAFAFDPKIDSLPGLLPVIAIFGANASGKSTFTRAMDFFRSMVLISARFDEDAQINVTPFLLSKASATEPSEFEIGFITNSTRYKYGFSATAERIETEWMLMVPNGGRTNELFRRSYNSSSKQYDWYINDKSIKGPKNSWRMATTKNSLFLSTAVKLNAEAFKEPYNWIKQDFKILHEDQSIAETYTAEAFTSSGEVDRVSVLNFIQAADVSVSDVVVEERVIPEDVLNSIPEPSREEFKDAYKYNVKFGHLKEDGSKIYWDISEESGGVQKLFTLAGPIVNVLDTGKTFVIDELHNRLHPKLLEYLISIFQNKNLNRKNAQLILTSHDVTVMNPEILNKDQIWFVEKGEDKSSRLYSLTSLRSRETLFWRSYIQGKFGAIPRVREPDLFNNKDIPSLFDLPKAQAGNS